MACIGEEIPGEPCLPLLLPLVEVEGAREKFPSVGRVEGGGRDTSCVMGEGLQSELVSGERVEGERVLGGGGGGGLIGGEREGLQEARVREVTVGGSIAATTEGLWGDKEVSGVLVVWCVRSL